MPHLPSKLIALAVATGAVLGTVLLGAAGNPQTPSPPPRPTPARPQAGAARPANAAPAVPAQTLSPMTRQLINQHCVTCHNDRLKTAGLSLQELDVNRVDEHAEIWEKVAAKLSSGLMPPVGRPRPDAGQVNAFVSGLYERLNRAATAAPNPGRPVTHRLNRTEYTNAISDLFALEIDPRTLLPADDTDQHGFDNNGEVLSLSPTLLERYLSAARKISRLALGHPGPTTSIETYTVSKLLTQDNRASERLPFGTRGGTAVTHNFPVDGEYAITIRLQKTLYSTVRGLARPHELEVRLDRQRIKQFTVGGADITPPPLSFAATLSWTPEWEAYANHADADLKLRFAASAGTHTVGVAFSKQAWEPEDVRQPPRSGWAFETDEVYDANPGVESVTIEGPFAAAGAGETTSRRRIFVCRPEQAADRNNSEAACARRILTPITRRAYRRPVTADDIDTLMTFFEAGRRDGGFEAGIESAMQRVLVSPDFLFRIEVEPERVAPGAPYRLTDIEFASRLSFFLWSTGPDDELLDLAARGVLRNPVILQRQVRRLLGDSRSSALVRNFAAQWLQLRDLRGAVPDPDLFPEFDENLREGFRQETELFLDSQIREDKPITDLLTANYTFVNERVARHYQIPGIYGSRFRRVALDESTHRGGLLGQASLLTVTSYPNRTSPVLRGKWLLENFLGTPPPPPPPDVPALKDKGVNGERQSVRERLQEHRKNAVCATCHAQMDPLGFALEHFDAIGQYRTVDEARTPVDASAALPSGTEFDGLDGLRAMLLGRREQFVGTVSERLLSFALGRGVEFYDRPALRQFVRRAADGNYHWSAIIIGIIESTPFQMRRAES